MRLDLIKLIQRIENEIPVIDEVVTKTIDAWIKGSKEPSEVQDIYLGYVALNLQGFYSGVERLLELIASNVDKNLPSGSKWHRDLLIQMSNEYENIRPPVISKEVADNLKEFQKFRHVVRNIYTTSLSTIKIAELLDLLPEMWNSTKSELFEFVFFLNELKSI